MRGDEERLIGRVDSQSVDVDRPGVGRSTAVSSTELPDDRRADRNHKRHRTDQRPFRPRRTSFDAFGRHESEDSRGAQQP